MNFDGAKSRMGVGAGIVFTSPQTVHFMLCFHLEFEATKTWKNMKLSYLD
jgi:hypothetical protein